LKIKEFLNSPLSSYILQKLLKKDKAWLFLNDELEVPKEFFGIYEKVKSGYPVEYIFKEVEFFGDIFYIQEGVLIPRDDTEVVVQRAIEVIKKFDFNLVVDCCTGSGVIAMEIAKHTNAKVIATDISFVALEVAKKNAKLHNVNIQIKECDLFCDKADLLVANPPYVETSWKKPNKYEPDLAFFAGEDGLDIVRKLILKAKNNFKCAIIEIGFNQKEPLQKFLKEHSFKEFSFFNDLTGNIRGVEIFF
jgi:release factor glutamine methyltransferase